MPELLTAVVDYTHGKDAFDEDGDNDNTNLRSFLMGDIFHSNLMFVGMPGRRMMLEDGYADYRSTYGPRDRVLYVGANDGLLHAFDAGAYWDGVDPNQYDAGDGEELFGYVPGPCCQRCLL